MPRLLRSHISLMFSITATMLITLPSSLPITQDTIPWISEDWTPDNEPSLRGHEYTPTADDLLAFRTRTNAFYEDGNPVARFTDCFKNKYPVRF
jgi:hypothetical protein